MAIVIGITGGIGSGKSYFARQMEGLGLSVYYSDREAKRLIAEDPALQRQIQALLGEDVFQDGVYQTRIVAARVFGRPDLLEALNRLVHPAVLADAERWIAAHDAEQTVMLESALLFESGLNRLCQKTVCITAPEEVCIARVIKRDGVSEEHVRARIASQMPDDERRRLSDFVLLSGQ